MYTEDTIAAITTPPGVGGVSIIRLSGKDSFTIANACFRDQKQEPLSKRQNRTIQYGHIVNPEEEESPIDEVLLLLMKGPHSYTAEDVVEIQCHGGYTAVQEILKVVIAQGARMAEPGEFTKRAFLNGRIDLTEAEAIADIIDAKTDKSLQLAVNQLGGALSKKVGALREALITLIARLEVTIDYPEEDIEEVSINEARETIQPIVKDMKELLETAQSGQLIRDGLMAVIIGRPNAGKSSLLNALLRKNRAIVTDIPGTTRDSIEEIINVDGIVLRLVDTAGLRETEDAVEQFGVEKAKEYINEADLIIAVVDASTPLTAEEKDILQAISGKATLICLNKEDKGVCVTAKDIEAIGQFSKIAPISAAQGEGLTPLRELVKELVYGGQVIPTYQALLTNTRQITLMETAYKQLQQSLETMDQHMPIDCVVTDIRGAWESLGEITGQSVGQSIVDELFSRFCLGK
ncbi:MAG: tRNA uridine-5-carboxymethylaminomethyl(34) synthesis GTPase MnmE [Veillonellaceae bacterium]|nr:tRNA uridine-5-carboxymethylaminomethyl(34) synthesis GTPase MnmE [Veillonellaceae bacterium]